jgi:hypothetical protein
VHTVGIKFDRLDLGDGSHHTNFRGCMLDNVDHIKWAAEAVAVFQKHCGTSDDHAIADLICDLGHLAEHRGFNFLNEVKRGIGHWYAEHHASDRHHLGPDAVVEITITLK